MVGKRPTLAANVRPATPTTAATERRPAALTVASRISPTVLPSVRPARPAPTRLNARDIC